MDGEPEGGATSPARDDRFRTDHLQSTLTRRSVLGSAVTLGAQGVKVVVQFATIVVLARLLSPADFGLFAIVAAFLTIFELFKDLGLSSATVQRRHITHRQVSTLFWMNVLLGTAIAGLFAFAASAIAKVYGEPVLAELAPVAALTLVLTGVAAQHLAVLRRQMRFSALAGVQTGAEIVAMAAALGAAMSGYGIWSLVIQRLAWSAVIAVGAWVATGWRPGLPGRFADVRGLVAFGGNVTAAMVLGRCAGSVDKILIGWYWGAVPLGLFERAQKLINMPIQNVNMPLSAVALPMLSRLADRPDRYRRAYIAIVERVALAVAPAAGLIVAAAAPLVDLILGPQWGDMAPVLAWLGVSAVYMPLTYTLSWLYMSQDRTAEMLRAAAVNTVLTIGAIAIALPFGLVAVAAALALSGALVRVPVLFWLVSRRGPLSPGDFFRMLALPSAGAAAAAGAVAAAGSLAGVQELSNGAQAGLFATTAFVSAFALYVAAPRGRRAIAETVTIRSLLVSNGAPGLKV